jgi:membrane protease YdiL (CAAX protease family)
MTDVELPFSLPSAPPPPIECWRCGKTFGGAMTQCPFCRASVVSAPTSLGLSIRNHGTIGDDPWSPIVKLIVFYGVLLVTSIVFGLIQRARFENVDELTPEDDVWLLQSMLVMEVIDTILIVAAWRSLGRPTVTFPGVSRRFAWAAAAPGLALLLALNYAYHFALSQFVPTIDDPRRLIAGYEAVYLVGYCLQPAIVEELFFRGLALEWFRTSMTTRGALIVSSVMFGMVHIYSPASVLYLMVAGLAFGAARIVSNGLLLPMILHFFHNLVVVLVEQYRT